MTLYHVTFKFKDNTQFKAPMNLDAYDTIAQKLRETFTKCLPKQFKHLSFDKDILSIELFPK